MSDPKTILFVDDDDVFRMTMRRVCREIPRIGNILEAEHGAVALDMIQRCLDAGEPLPDLAFVDINMPVLDGFGFLAGLRALADERPEAAKIHPVLMMSSSDQQQDKDRAFELGASDYFVKGHTLEELRRTVREATA